MMLNSQHGIEADRIAALYQIEILDTDTEEDYDNITELAAQIVGTPFATIAFEDEGRWWYKATYGIELYELPGYAKIWHDESIANEFVLVEDIHIHNLFANHPLRNNQHGIKFFAAVPISDENGFILGHLSVMGTNPQALTQKQISALQLLGRQASSLLRLRHKLNKLEKEYALGSEEQINNIFHNAIDAVIVIEPSGEILQWNPKATELFKWTVKEAIGKYFHETLIAPEYYSQYLSEIKSFENSSVGLVPHKTIELIGVRKDRSEFDCALGISPTQIKGKDYFICFMSDITERKLATKKLDKQKEFYENILNHLPTDIAVFDPNHRYLFVNPGGIKDPELRKYIIGKDDFEYCEYRQRDKSLAQLRRNQFLEVKNSNKEIRWEDSVIDPDGNSITHLRRIFPVHDENGVLTMVIGMGLDITDRKMLEEKQTLLVKQLSTQNTQLVDFCNIVSHNLRGPLVNMSMLVEFIEESEDLEEQEMLILKLKPVIDNLHTTFNELVESIQIKQDLEIKSEIVLFEDCLKRTIQGLDVEINKCGATLDVDFEDAPMVYFPQKYLFSIFHNLVSNALKYQSPLRKAIIKIRTKRLENTVLLTVEDNGLGIDLIKHKENFFKIGKVFHHHPNAKGFGLFMTKTQVEAMDGKIWVESTPGEGSTFFIEFKIHYL